MLFIASYVLLATLGGTGSGQRVRRRSGPLMIALVVAVEGATVALLWYRITLEAWLNLGLAFFASSYLLLQYWRVSGVVCSGGGNSVGGLRLLRTRHPSDPVTPRVAPRKPVRRCGSVLTCGVGAFPVCWPWWLRWKYWPTRVPGVRTLPASSPHALQVPSRTQRGT